MAEQNLPAQIKKSTSSDNRIRIGIGQADGSVKVQGVRIQAGFLGGVPFDAGQSVAVVRQDKTWLVLGVVYGTFTPAIHYQAGSDNINVAAATSVLLPVLFARPFASAPAVSTNINSGAGATGSWQSRAINITEAGFTIFAFGPSNTFTAPVAWQAQAVTQ
jgi:hypothetical protein